MCGAAEGGPKKTVKKQGGYETFHNKTLTTTFLWASLRILDNRPRRLHGEADLLQH